MRFADEHGYYELNPFPGNANVCVSNHAFIKPHYRGQGHGKAQHVARLNKARELGYTYILCTVNPHNELERHILAANNWRELDGFWSDATNVCVSLWGRAL